MAKMFYNLQETETALGKNEEEIKQLAREGKLREFRDGRQLMFKVDQVEALKAELGPMDQVDLGPSDSGAPIGMIDSRGASGTGITLTDTDAGSGSGLAKDDTALAADLGLSGSVGGVPSPNRAGSGGSQGSRSGVDIFGAEDIDRVDPSAQTAISSEQINLEGVGSGSGLLDLTRESDDTSLGAVLDEIKPPGGVRTSGPETLVGTQAGLDAVSEPRIGRSFGAPVYVEAADPWAPAFGAAALGGVIVLLVAAFAVTSAVLGTWSQTLEDLGNRGIPFVAGIGLAVALVLFIIGAIIGKASAK